MIVLAARAGEMNQNILYQIWEWGDATNEGSNEQFNVGIRTKAKRSLTNPHEVANEMLCLRLAEMLKLPVPPGGVLIREDHRYFTSIDYSESGEKLSPAPASDLQTIVTDETWLACGIIAFDCWIVNEDRRSPNIRYDRRKKTFYIIDHGRALFCGKEGARAMDELDGYRDQLVVNHNTNCLAARIPHLDDFAEWEQRICDIPKYFIRETIKQSVELGLPSDLVDYLVEFLLDRRAKLRTLFRNRPEHSFPKVEATLISERFEPLTTRDHQCESGSHI